MPRRPAASAAAAAVYLRHPTAVEEEVDPVEDEVADAVRPLAPELSPSPVPSQASSRLSHSTGRHPSHISFDTDAVRRRNNSDGSAVGQITMTSYQPLQWTIPPAFHQPANAGGMEQAQVVLQQPNAMVVYDPPAHELVVYSHSNPPLLTSSPPAESSPMAAVAIRQLQPFSQQIFRGHEEADMHMPRACRLCRRPFTRWDTYAGDPDEYTPFDAQTDLRHFTSNDYFHLLAATTDETDDVEHQPQQQQQVRVEEGEEEEEERPSRETRARSRRRQTRSAPCVEEEDEDAEEHKAGRNRRHPIVEEDGPSYSLRSRSHRGVPIRRQAAAPMRSGPTISASSSTEDLTAQHGGDDSAPPSSAASEAEHEEDGSEPAHLSRSSFNSGYYARFFREERKIGSGGVGGVFLTHHVLDGVMLGTYAVKKIPVGNSRPWLVQVLKEVRALEGLHHRHIVAYKHSWLESFKPSDFGPEVPCLFLLMEYADRGTLAQMIWPKQGISAAAAAAASRRVGGASSSPVHLLTEDQIWSVFIGILLGLRHLHRAGVIHRDLKPENILLTGERSLLGEETGGLRVLVSDFGNAILKGAPYARTGNTGTLAYAAPETLVPREEFEGRFGIRSNGSSGGPASPSSSSQQLDCDFSQDLWSCGVILHAMAYSALPFQSQNPEALFAEIAAGGRGLQLPSNPVRSNDMKSIIRSLLSLDPRARPSLDSVLNLPFILQTREQRFNAEASARGRMDGAARGMDQQGMGGGGSGGMPSGAAAAAQGRMPLESYKPPRANAFLLSPLLPAALPRASSPTPLSLGGRDGLASGTAGTGGVSKPSAVRIEPAGSPSEGNETPLESTGGALILSRSGGGNAKSWIDVIDERQMGRVMKSLRKVMDAVFETGCWTMGKLGRRQIHFTTACWRCEWSSLHEAIVHLVGFLLKLWLSLSLLLQAPSPSAMYLHVFPEVLGLLVLVVTSLMVQPRYPVVISPRSKHSVSSRMMMVQRKLFGTTERWQGNRAAVAVGLAMLSMYWLESTSSSGGSVWWHTINTLVLLASLLAILCSFYSTHPSHTFVHRGLSPQRASTFAPARARTIPVHRHAPSVNTPEPDASPIAGRDGLAMIPNTGQVIARLPLLLPPARTAQRSDEDPRSASPTPKPLPSSGGGGPSRVSGRRRSVEREQEQEQGQQQGQLIEEARRLR